MWSSSIGSHFHVRRFVELMLESGLGQEQVEPLLIANPRPRIRGQIFCENLPEDSNPGRYCHRAAAASSRPSSGGWISWWSPGSWEMPVSPSRRMCMAT